MATDLEETLIQDNIEEYVNDDNKIVTCRWLSLMLNLNINDAKRALNTFIKNHRNKPTSGVINVTYFVAGLGKSKDGEPMHKCVVVPEAHLEEVKKSLSIVTSCHIYSVQKARLKDYTSLYLTDYDIIRNNLEKCQLLSSIKCPWVSLRQSKPSVQSQGSSSKIKAEKDETLASISTTSNSAKVVSRRAEPKGSIANMFASVGKRDEKDEKTPPALAKVNEPTAPSAKANVKSKPVEKKGGVLSLFSKQEVKNAETNKKAASEKESSKTSSTILDPSATKSYLPNKTQAKEKINLKKRTKGSDDEDDEVLERKHRRRIRTDLFESSDEEEHVSDVEEKMQVSPVGATDVGHGSDEEEAMEEVEEMRVKECVVSEDVKENVTTNRTNTGGCRKRKRTQKVASKTFVDEDGFFVTTKVTEWESESDDEVEVQEQKPQTVTKKNSVAQKTEPKGKAPSKKAAVSPQKGKQTSLMSFFKKK